MVGVKLSSGVVKGNIIRRNGLTVWVRLENGDEIKVKPEQIVKYKFDEVKQEAPLPKVNKIKKFFKDFFNNEE